jgi:hypothetical protein
MQLLLCILASVEGIFLRIHVFHFTPYRKTIVSFVVISQ